MVNEQQVKEIIRQELRNLIRSDKYTFEKPIRMSDGQNIEAGTSTGSSFGDSTTEKISLYGVTPIVQRSGAAQAAVSGTADATYSANEVTLINDLVTLANELRAALVALGQIKGSA